MITFNKIVATAMLASSAAFSISANATLVLATGLVGGSGDVQNVQFNGFTNPPGTTVLGDLSGTGEDVIFTGTENLITPSGGQARIEAEDGEFDFISIMFADTGIGFNKIQFNIDAVSDGAADITLTDQFGTDFIFSAQTLDGSGQNIFTGQGLDGQVIVKATIDTTVAITALADLAQVRLGPTAIPDENGNGEPPVATVPEPGTLALLSLGLLGLVTQRRQRT